MLSDYCNLRAIVLVFDIDTSARFTTIKQQQEYVEKYMQELDFKRDGTMYCYSKNDLSEKEFLKKAIQIINYLSSVLCWMSIKTAKVIILSDNDDTIYGGKVFSII